MRLSRQGVRRYLLFLSVTILIVAAIMLLLARDHEDDDSSRGRVTWLEPEKCFGILPYYRSYSTGDVRALTAFASPRGEVFVYLRVPSDTTVPERRTVFQTYAKRVHDCDFAGGDGVTGPLPMVAIIADHQERCLLVTYRDSDGDDYFDESSELFELSPDEVSDDSVLAKIRTTKNEFYWYLFDRTHGKIWRLDDADRDGLPDGTRTEFLDKSKCSDLTRACFIERASDDGRQLMLTSWAKGGSMPEGSWWRIIEDTDGDGVVDRISERTGNN